MLSNLIFFKIVSTKQVKPSAAIQILKFLQLILHYIIKSYQFLKTGNPLNFKKMCSFEMM